MLSSVTNFAKATLTAGISAGATSFSVSTGEGAEFPSPSTDGSFNLVIWNFTDYPDPADDPLKEIVTCDGRVSDGFTIIRAQEGTSDNNHNISSKTYKIVLAFTKQDHDEIAIQYATISVSSSYTASMFGNILIDATVGDVPINLPSSSGISGRIYTIKKVSTDTNDVIITPNGSETIDGQTTLELRKPYTAVRIVTDGNNFFII